MLKIFSAIDLISRLVLSNINNAMKDCGWVVRWTFKTWRRPKSTSTSASTEHSPYRNSRPLWFLPMDLWLNCGNYAPTYISLEEESCVRVMAMLWWCWRQSTSSSRVRHTSNIRVTYVKIDVIPVNNVSLLSTQNLFRRLLPRRRFFFA